MDYQKFHTELQEAGNVIWNDLFHVVVAQKHTLSPNHLTNIGIPTTGIHEYDVENHNAKTPILLNIDSIVENFKVGIPMTLPNKNEIVIIYNAVNRYLQAWYDVLRYSINVGQAPVEDLLLLDRFATDLYTQVHLVTGKAPDERPNYSNKIGRYKTLSASDMFANPNTTSVEETKKEPGKRHKSFAQDFAQRLIGSKNAAQKNTTSGETTSPTSIAGRRWNK